jgi:hypothetical protein
MSRELAQKLRNLVDGEVANLQAVNGEKAAAKAGPERWSRKEELGHLIDSAANNHIRIVRAALEAEFQGAPYDQRGWVRAHAYQELPWPVLVEFWSRYNGLLAHVVERIPGERLSSNCVITGYPPFTLGGLIEDYMRHLRHHLDHILKSEA